MQRSHRIALIAAAVVVAVIAFVLLSPSDDDGGDSSTTAAQTTTANEITETFTATDPQPEPEPEPEPTEPIVVIADGQPQGGVQTLEFKRGDPVRFKVRSDAAAELHLHGYDIEKQVPAGGTASFAFKANLEGVFELEIHGAGTKIAELSVEP